jgi:hypothetical protein
VGSLLAAITVEPITTTKLLDALGAFASVVGVVGAGLAFVTWLISDEVDEVGASLTVGTAIGFYPGICMAIVVLNSNPTPLL